MKFASLRILSFLTLFVATCAHGPLLYGQEDPFNDDPFQASPFDDPESAEEAKPVPDAVVADDSQFSTKVDPLLQTIIGSDPQTPAQLIKAIDMLMNIEKYELATDYAKKLAASKLTDEQSYALYKQVGSDMLFRLQFSQKIGMEAARFARSVFVGAEKYAMDAKRIETLVGEVIENEDRYQRSVALADLKVLGDTGAAALVEKLVDNDLRDKWPRIRQAIRLFGKSAEGPLLAARHSNSLKLRIEALHLLESVPTQTAIENIMRPLWSASSTDLQRRVAQQSIQRLTGKIPSKEECEDTLYLAGRRYLMDQSVVGTAAEDQVKWWYWNPETRALSPVWLTPRTIARNRGFRRAKDLIDLNPGERDYQKLYWVTRLESAKLTAGVDRPLPATVLKTLVESIPADMANEVLNESLKLRRVPASIAACEVIGGIVRSGNSANVDFLSSTGRAGSPLVKALDLGSVRLTNAACNAIHDIDPQQPFIGSSKYLSTLVYLSQSIGTRTALVAHVNLETARSIASLINRNGYTCLPAVTPQQLFEQAKNDPDLQLLVITDSLSRPGFSELVQALRSSPRTRLIPILLMVQPENKDRADRLASRFSNVLVTPMAVNDLVMARQVDNLQRGLAYRDANAIERSDQAVKSLEYLSSYASQPERYPFYNLIKHQKQLLGSLGTPTNAATTCQLMGQLGTADAQVSLVDMASNGQLPMALRQVAANAFREAVTNKGVMLSREQILDQYKRYNASENQPQATQKILGDLLDTIERRTPAKVNSLESEEALNLGGPPEDALNLKESVQRSDRS